MSNQPLFAASFADGYPFRYMMGVINAETAEVALAFSEGGIDIRLINRGNYAVHFFRIQGTHLRAYYYNIRDEHGQLVDLYPIHVDTAEMFKATKGIGKRDGIKLYWLQGDNRISIQPVKAAVKDSGGGVALFVPILSREYNRYELPSFPRHTPNIRIQAKEFSDICSQASNLKCAFVEIIGHSAGMTFRGVGPDKTELFIKRYPFQRVVDPPPSSSSSSSSERAILSPDLDALLESLSTLELGGSSPLRLNVVKSTEIARYRIPISTIKALTKMHNISPQGTMLKLHFGEQLPLKIKSPIGAYGKYTLCLRDSAL